MNDGPQRAPRPLPPAPVHLGPPPPPKQYPGVKGFFLGSAVVGVGVTSMLAFCVYPAMDPQEIPVLAATLLGLLLSVPIVLPASSVLAAVARRGHRNSGEWLRPVLVIGLVMVVAFWAFYWWMDDGLMAMASTASRAVDELAFPLTRALWKEMQWASLVIFPALIGAIVLDVIILPFLPFFYMPFLKQMAWMSLRILAILGIGTGLGLVLSRRWLKSPSRQ